MKAYDFSLRLEGVPLDEDGFLDFSNALFEHAPDCCPGASCGVVEVGFDRTAASLRDAVASAIESVRRAAPSARVVGVFTEDGLTIDEAFAA